MMITSKYLQSIVIKFRYEIKPDTKGSFYRVLGNSYLPIRLSFSQDDLAPVKKVGRVISLTKAGSFIGKFCNDEQSPLKLIKGGVIRGRIWVCQQNPRLLGYSDLGFTNEQGVIQEGSDLIVFRSPDNGKTILEIEVYQGCYRQRESILPLIK